MKIFITGISGRLGRALAIECAARGWQSVGISRHLPEQELPATVVHVADYSKPADYQHLLAGCDAVIHCAAMHYESGSGLGLAEHIDANVTGTARLLDAALQAGIKRFILASSGTTFIGYWPEVGVGVLDRRAPDNYGHPYPFSKVLMEKLGEGFAISNDVSVCSIRLMTFYDDPDQMGICLATRAYTSRDAALSCLAALDGEWRGETFITGPDSPFSTSDLRMAQTDPGAVLESRYPGCMEVLERIGKKPKPDDFRVVADISHAKRHLHWQPVETFEWWLKTKGWIAPR